jgi:hypothetical protein
MMKHEQKDHDMTAGTLEQLNITVSNPEDTADMLCRLFDWHIRWSGESLIGGRSIHVGGDKSYLAIYTDDQGTTASTNRSYTTTGSLNHVGVLVDELDLVEERVVAAGFVPTNQGDYEPGQRFYFHDADGIEFEVVSYSS